MVQTGERCLSGVKVIELATVLAGPLCDQILGDHGAEIIKVEPPFGELGRTLGPSYNSHGFSSHFFSTNRNKRTISLDITTARGREVLFRLLNDADVLVSNFKPGTLERYGLGYEDVLSKRFPRLICASVSAFGGDGPLGGLPGMDPVGQALSGVMAGQGSIDGAPDRINIPVADLSSGLYLAIGILMAIIERSKSGRGQALETTLLESCLTLNHPFAADWLMSGKPQAKMGNGHASAAPMGVYPCADGYIHLGTLSNSQFRSLIELMGLPELLADRRFATREMRVENRQQLDDLTARFCLDKLKAPLARQLLERGVPAAEVLTVAEALSHPQITSRGMIYEDTSVGYRGVGTPIKLTRTPGGMSRPPGEFGLHNFEVLREIGYCDTEIDELINSGVVFTSPTNEKMSASEKVSQSSAA